MVQELKLVKIEKQVSKPLVVSCTRMQAHVVDIKSVRITSIVIAYIYIHNFYIIKYKDHGRNVLVAVLLR